MDSSSVVDPKNSIVYFPGTSVYHINIIYEKIKNITTFLNLHAHMLNFVCIGQIMIWKYFCASYLSLPSFPITMFVNYSRIVAAK